MKILFLIPVLILVGCASPNIDQGYKESKVEVPVWYLNLPKKQGAVYSSGTGLSKDLQFSQDMAILNAKSRLADQVRSKTSAVTKSLSTQRGKNEKIDNEHRLEKTIKNIVKDVELSGYDIIRAQTVREGDSYRTFVVLKYNFEDRPAIINKDKISQEEFDRAFRELN